MAITYGTIINTNTVTITDPYTDRVLRGFMPKGLIVKELFGQVPSSTYKGRIPKQNTPAQVRSELTIGNDGFPVIKFDFEASDTYKIVPRGLTAQASAADIEELGGAALAQNRILSILDVNVQLSREYQVAKNATDITVQTQYFTPALTWDDPNADIMGDIRSIVSIVRTGVGTSAGCGELPNTAIVPWPVYNVLSRHPQLIKAYFFGVQGQNKEMQLSRAQMANLFGVDRVLIPEALYYSNSVGATQSRTDIWGKNVIMAKIDYALNPSMASQSWGYSFVPSNDAVGLAEFSYTWQTPGVLSNFLNNFTKGFMADDKLVDVTAACLVPSVIA